MSGFSSLDHARMARALYLAGRVRNGSDPNPRVGCVIDSGGVIVGEGFHRRAGGPHAEICALQAAGEYARDATAFVTLEPCNHQGRTGPCTKALMEAGIRRVVFAIGDPNRHIRGGGNDKLKAAGIVVAVGLLHATAEQLNRGFFRRMRESRPFVCSKIAASVDGGVALPGSRNLWISSPASRQDVQHMRSRASAILTGIGTVLADDPQLTVRLEADDSWRQPVRVVLDSNLRTPVTAKVVGDQCLIFASEAASAAREQELAQRGARIIRIAVDDNGLKLPAVISELARLEINEVMVEAGPILNGALLRSGLLDEVVVYRAPVKLGGEARPMFEASQVTDIEDHPQFRCAASRQIGNDWRLRYVAGSV